MKYCCVKYEYIKILYIILPKNKKKIWLNCLRDLYRRNEGFLPGHTASDIPSQYMYYVLYINSDGLSDAVCPGRNPVHCFI